MAAELTLTLLGSFEAALDDQPITRFESDKVRALLAYLVVEGGRPHRRDALAALFWPDSPPERARRNLNQALSNLRLAIGDREAAAPLVSADRNSVALDQDGRLQADVIAFEGLLAANWRHQHRDAATCAVCTARRAEAAALYKGDFLKGFVIDAGSEFDDWLILQRESLHRKAMEAMTNLSDYHEGRWELAQARHYAEHQVQLEPWREQAHLQLMRLLARSGQRGAALQQYAQLEVVLEQEFGVGPAEETRQLYERIRAVEEQAPRRKLPLPSTAFLGREAELADLALQLARPDTRLLTVLGPGGVGKSRLAVELAERMANLFLEGVYFVALATLPESSSLPAALADVLDFPLHGGELPLTQLQGYLRGKEMLLILDGFEHLSAGGPVVTALLREAPQLKVLVTSRVRLQAPGENVYELTGLSTPPVGATRELAPYDAVQLFVQRARQSQHAFSLSADNAGQIGRICRLVGGLPLALELAAAWVRALSCQEIADEIEAGLHILSLPDETPAEQRNLRAVFDHSWQLLPPQGQAAFSRLSLFPGGFTRAAASTVAGLSLATLTSLVDHSLVRRAGDGRFEMHELLRQYAAEKLAEAPPEEREGLEERLVDYYLVLAGAHQDDYLLLAQESANILAAMAEAHKRQMWRANVTFAAVLAQAWFARARYSDARRGYRWACQAAERLGDRAALAEGLRHWAWACIEQADYQKAEERLNQSRRLSRELGDRVGYADALYYRGRIALEQFDFNQTNRLLSKSLELFRTCGHQAGVAKTLYLLADIPFYRQDYERAAEMCREALAIQEEIGDKVGAIRTLGLLAMTALKQQDHQAGEDYCLRALVLCDEADEKAERAVILYNLAEALRNQGALAEAEERARQSQRLASEMGDRKLEARTLWRRSLIQLDAGEYELALASSKRSNALFVQIQDDWSRIYVLRLLGDIYQALGQAQQARRAWLEAVGLRVGEGHPEYKTVQRRLKPA